MLLTENSESKNTTCTLTNKTLVSEHPDNFSWMCYSPAFFSLDGTVFRMHLVGGIPKISANTKSFTLQFLLQMKGPEILNQEKTGSKGLQGTRGIPERHSHL